MSSDRKQKPQLVILISGGGSNLQAFIDQCASGELEADIACVIANNPEAKGLERARKAGIAQCLVNHKDYPSREAFDIALAQTIKPYQPDLVILAGFMRILTPNFVNQFAGKMLNIHPSLLPKYPGLHTHQQAIDAKDSVAGATVHFVTAELDGGPAIAQANVIVAKDETADSLAAKVLQQEHIIYPQATAWFLQGRLILNNNLCFLDQKKLPPQGKSL